MKAFSLLTFAFIISLAFYSCKKSSAGSTKPAASTWTLNGISYSGDSSYSAIIDSVGIDSAGYFAGGTEFNSMDAGAIDEIYLDFGNTPTEDTTYTVIRPYEITSTSQVVLLVVKTAGSGFISSGIGHVQVKVSVSGNLITATFANVPVENNGTTEMVSGTIVAKAE
jgi:hypothetical protein